MGAMRGRSGTVGGWVLVVLGVVFLCDELFDVNLLGTFWPVGIIALGVWMLMGARDRDGGDRGGEAR